MISNFLKKTKPMHWSLVILLSIVVCTSNTNINHIHEKIPFSLGWTINIILFLFILIIIHFISRKNQLTQNNMYTQLLALFIASNFSHITELTSSFFSTIFLLLAFRRIYSFKSPLNLDIKLFDSGLWIALATLLEPSSLIYIILLYYSLILFNRQTHKNIFAPLFGLISVLLLYFTYCLWFDLMDDFWHRFVLIYNLPQAISEFTRVKFIIFMALGLWGSVVSFSTFTILGKIQKRYWYILTLHFVLASLNVLFSYKSNPSISIQILFPLSIIIAKGLQVQKKLWINDSIIYGLFLISIVNYFIEPHNF